MNVDKFADHLGLTSRHVRALSLVRGLFGEESHTLGAAGAEMAKLDGKGHLNASAVQFMVVQTENRLRRPVLCLKTGSIIHRLPRSTAAYLRELQKGVEVPETVDESTSVEFLDIRFPDRLMGNGFMTLGDLMAADPRRLLRMKNFGTQSLRKIAVALRLHGLCPWPELVDGPDREGLILGKIERHKRAIRNLRGELRVLGRERR